MAGRDGTHAGRAGRGRTGQGGARARFVREAYWPALPPPEHDEGPFAFMRDTLFRGVGDTLLTLAAAALIGLALYALADFAVFSAIPPHGEAGACRAAPLGACWPFILAKLDAFVYGPFPRAERWRIDLAGLLLLSAAGLVALAPPSERLGTILAVCLGYPVVAAVLLSGGVLGLARVDAAQWGGLSLTALLVLSVMLAALPLGVALALARRSSWPLVRLMAWAFITVWGAVPVVVLLLMAAAILPPLLPPLLPPSAGMGLLGCAMAVMVMASAARVAGVMGEGLRAAPRGQWEAARMLGLGRWHTLTRVILPGALAHVLPALAATVGALVKDTALVALIGLSDFLSMVRLALADTAWTAPGTTLTAHAFAAFVFWAIGFGLARYAAWIERRVARAGGGEAAP